MQNANCCYSYREAVLMQNYYYFCITLLLLITYYRYSVIHAVEAIRGIGNVDTCAVDLYKS